MAKLASRKAESALLQPRYEGMCWTPNVEWAGRQVATQLSLAMRGENKITVPNDWVRLAAGQYPDERYRCEFVSASVYGRAINANSAASLGRDVADAIDWGCWQMRRQLQGDEWARGM